MPLKTGHLFIAAAIFMGILTVVLFTTMNSGEDKKPTVTKTQLETTNVVVPLVPILKGETLSLDQLKVVAWPKDFVPQGATFQSAVPLLGRVPLQDLFPGQPIYAQMLSESATGGLPALIPPGRRAITISVTEVKGVAGFVKPGDHVDVLSTFSLESKNSDGGKSNYHRTVTVLQDVLVLASAQSMVEEDKKYEIETPEGITNGEVTVKKTPEEIAAEEKEAKKDRRKKDKDKKEENTKEKSEKDLAKERKQAQKDKIDAEKRAKLVSSVTLAVTPEQAQTLTLAEEAGQLRLALRSASDTNAIQPAEPVQAVESDDVIFAKGSKKRFSAPPAMPKAPMLPPPTARFGGGNNVELIEGTTKSSVQF